MEVDILNDLLSRTVSNLFQNKSKHMSYVSEDDDNKSDLFLDEEPIIEQKESKEENQKKNISIKNNNINNQANQNETNLKKNLIEKLINNNAALQKNNSKNLKNKENSNITPEIKEENLSPKKWCLTVGKKKYEEALKRLQLSEKIILSKNLLTQMNLEQLTEEKAKVKQELKKYDEDFYHIFKTKPSKENKEVMKVLYYYYQKLKSEIAKKSNNTDNNNTETIIMHKVL